MKRRLLVLFLFAVSVGYVHAQHQVSGKVTSGEDGSSLPGVNVVVVESQQGSITDIDGNYKLDIPENSSLRFSYIGYVDVIVQVGNQTVQKETRQGK